MHRPFQQLLSTATLRDTSNGPCHHPVTTALRNLSFLSRTMFSLTPLCATVLLFAVTAHPLTVLAQVACPLGSFVKQGQCQLCQPGTYSDEKNRTSCKPCRPGYYYPFHGAKSFHNCLKCPAGTYAASRASTTCKPCPSPKYSWAGAPFCLRCPPGKGLTEYSHFCAFCRPGYYNDGTFNYCTRCSSGTYANKPLAATACLPCPKGTFQDLRYIPFISRRECSKCPTNTYSDREGTVQCPLCPLGTVSNPGSTTCSPCPPNTFRDGIKKVICTACDMGTTARPGSAGCRHPIKGCPFDTFEDASGACKACLPGEYQDTQKKSCVRCADDEVSRGGAVTVCTKCVRNTEPASDLSLYERSKCRCKVGYQFENDGSCVPCPPGYYGAEETSKFRNTHYRVWYDRQPECRNCYTSYSDKPASKHCSICPKDSYSSRDSTTCIKCPTGSVSSPEEPYFDNHELKYPRDGCRSIRHNCNVGEVRSDDGKCTLTCHFPARMSYQGRCEFCYSFFRWSLKEKRCVRCPPGTVSDLYQTNTTCEKCMRYAIWKDGKCVCEGGRAMSADGKRCERCPGDFVLKNRECVKCKVGVVRKSGGRSDIICGACRGDTYLPQGALKCVPCPFGYEKMYDVVGNVVIDQCRPVDPYSQLQWPPDYR